MNVKLVAEGGSSMGTRVFDMESGAEIKGICEATVKLRANDIVEVHLKLAASAIDVEGKAVFWVADPSTGKMREVAKVVFVEGDSVDFPA